MRTHSYLSVPVHSGSSITGEGVANIGALSVFFVTVLFGNVHVCFSVHLFGTAAVAVITRTYILEVRTRVRVRPVALCGQ